MFVRTDPLFWILQCILIKKSLQKLTKRAFQGLNWGGVLKLYILPLKLLSLLIYLIIALFQQLVIALQVLYFLFQLLVFSLQLWHHYIFIGLLHFLQIILCFALQFTLNEVFTKSNWGWAAIWHYPTLYAWQVESEPIEAQMRTNLHKVLAYVSWIWKIWLLIVILF